MYESPRSENSYEMQQLNEQHLNRQQQQQTTIPKKLFYCYCGFIALLKTQLLQKVKKHAFLQKVIFPNASIGIDGSLWLLRP